MKKIGVYKMEQFISFIEKSVTKLQQEEKELNLSDRKDESNLVKVKINIYGVCKTILEVVTNTNSPDTVKDAYVNKLTNMLHTWQESFEKAKKYNDVTKLVIEEIKLQTLEEICNKFVETWEA